MFPSGDSPEKVRQFYEYLQGHQQTTRPIQSWHVDWLSLAWLWGFVIVLVFSLLLWVRQYRTTRQRGIYPVDSFGGWTTEAAGPATLFFLLFTAVIVAFAVALVVGHIVYGQKF
jgi:hypothetical protein